MGIFDVKLFRENHNIRAVSDPQSRKARSVLVSLGLINSTGATSSLTKSTGCHNTPRPPPDPSRHVFPTFRM